MESFQYGNETGFYKMYGIGMDQNYQLLMKSSAPQLVI